ncbi:MAG: hypothetical protein H6662_08590 [Ardenticatenaceae bacterium]|nr:hypothetical protein [Ardenticatenaceae bacterium]MCB9003342.1 hypothetical protein [Ardenticatenaceae bacterium]
MEAILGLDVGTTTTKAVLFDLNGTELARASSPPYRNRTPQPGWVEQDPEEIWAALVTAVAHITTQLNPNITICALSMAVQSGSLLPADANGQPVYPLITWLDGRSAELVQEWREAGIPAQLKPINGWSLYPGFCLPNIAWLRQHNPRTFAAARRFLSLNDFLAYRLTGQFATNPSNGGGMQLVDIRTGQWSYAIGERLGITPEQLSPIRPSGSIIGKILPDVRRATGLPDGVVLVNGGHDQGCTALGLGVTAPGKLLLACGTAWVITGVMDTLALNRVPATLDWNFHALDDRYTISQSLGGLGAAMEWWLNQSYRGPSGSARRGEMFAALDAELAQTRSDNHLYFLPPTGGHNDRGAQQRGGFVGLQLGHSRADMARAVMESAAFELRWLLEPVQQAGLPVERLWMVGGAAQSPHWPQILADATGIPISLPQYDTWPALGTAVLAGVGIGAFASAAEGLARFHKPERDAAPDAAMQAQYDEMFEKYKEENN